MGMVTMEMLDGDAPADRAIKAAGGITGIWFSAPLTFRLANGKLLVMVDRQAHLWRLDDVDPTPMAASQVGPGSPPSPLATSQSGRGIDPFVGRRAMLEGPQRR